MTIENIVLFLLKCAFWNEVDLQKMHTGAIYLNLIEKKVNNFGQVIVISEI